MCKHPAQSASARTLVEDRRRWARQVVNLIDFDEQRLWDVVAANIIEIKAIQGLGNSKFMHIM